MVPGASSATLALTGSDFAPTGERLLCRFGNSAGGPVFAEVSVSTGGGLSWAATGVLFTRYATVYPPSMESRGCSRM